MPDEHGLIEDHLYDVARTYTNESLILGKRPWYLRLRGKLYLLLQRNALRAPDQFEIPPNRVIELGTQVEI